MSKSLDSLIARQVAKLTSYDSLDFADKPEALRLNANEYPEDSPVTVTLADMNRYPQAQSGVLKKAYAKYAGLKPDQVLVCRGGDEAIEVLVRAFCTPGEDEILICPPTYSMYAISAQTAGVGVLEVPMKGTDFDEEAIADAVFADACVKVLFLCNPNNPLGSAVSPQALESIVRRVAGRAIVVIDEAYIEFAASLTCAEFVKRYENVAVVRTLSKAFALAGLRCGFVLGNSRLISILRRVIAPYPTPVPVEVVASQALSPAGIGAMKKRVALNDETRAYLTQALREFSFVEEVSGSATNFVLVKTRLWQPILEGLQARNIYIRRIGIADTLRITVGTRQECEALIAAMAEIESEVQDES